MSQFEQCHRDGGKKRAPPGHRHDTRHHLYRHHGDRSPGGNLWKCSDSPGLRHHERNKQVRKGIHPQLGHCRLVCDSHCRPSLHCWCVHSFPSICLHLHFVCKKKNPKNNLSVTNTFIKLYQSSYMRQNYSKVISKYSTMLPF